MKRKKKKLIRQVEYVFQDRLINILCAFFFSLLSLLLGATQWLSVDSMVVHIIRFRCYRYGRKSQNETRVALLPVTGSTFQWYHLQFVIIILYIWSNTSHRLHCNQQFTIASTPSSNWIRSISHIKTFTAIQLLGS